MKQVKSTKKPKMIEQLKTGDELTIINVNWSAMTSISEIVVDSILENRIIYVHKSKRYYLKDDNETLVLKGHNLGITEGRWSNGNGNYTMLMSGDCNLGGLDRESMIALLKTNINDKYDQWQKIYWFDGKSEKGDPIFIPRPVSENYLHYRKVAEQNNIKKAGEINVGDFIYSYQKGSQHIDLTDMLRYHLTIDQEFSECLNLGKIVAILDMSDEEFDLLKYQSDEFELSHRGGSESEDIAEERQITDTLSEFEKETFYSLFTLIRTPSGRAITVDAQGYDYMRYTGLLSHYKSSMTADCEKAKELLRIEKEKAEAEKQAEKEEIQRIEKIERARIEKEYSFLTVITDYQDQNTIAKNVRSLLKNKFPATKFSVRKHYYDSYFVEWNNGPSVPQVKEITRLFTNKMSDWMADVSCPITSQFIKRYGSLGYISTSRNIDNTILEKELDQLNLKLGKTYKMEDYVTEKFEIASTLVHHLVYDKDYSPAIELETTPPSPKMIAKPICAQGIEIIDYSTKSFAVFGDTKPIKDILSDLGGSFNAHLKCGAGWIFSKTKLDTVKQALSIE